MFGNLIPNIFGAARQVISTVSTPWALQLVRGKKVRNYFPRPSETMRVRKHGWEARLSTLGGRKVLMRRILKGRHVLSH